MSSSLVCVKFVVGGSTHRFSVADNTTLVELQAVVKSVSGWAGELQYRDDEGDMVVVGSQMELHEALRIAQEAPRPLLQLFPLGDCGSGGVTPPQPLALVPNAPPKAEHNAKADDQARAAAAAAALVARARVEPPARPLRSATWYEERWPTHPDNINILDTAGMRKNFLVPRGKLFVEDAVNFTYSHCDRLVLGGTIPVSSEMQLDPIDPLRADFFLERRELCVWHVGGGKGTVKVGSDSYALDVKYCLYVGRGNKTVTFSSEDAKNPARFYLLSTLAYDDYPTQLIKPSDITPSTIGSEGGASLRDLYQYVTPATCKSSQICCGMTVVHSNSVWNTMPCHTHARRTEAYLYFDMSAQSGAGFTNRICHIMGPPQQTRCMWMSPEEAVIATPGFVHFGCGTERYSFIWCMAGENPFAFTDMDQIDPGQLL